MKSNQFTRYHHELEDATGVLCDYLFEKYNGFFDKFYLEECDGVVDKSSVEDTIMDESKLEVILNS